MVIRAHCNLDIGSCPLTAFKVGVVGGEALGRGPEDRRWPPGPAGAHALVEWVRGSGLGELDFS